MVQEVIQAPLFTPPRTEHPRVDPLGAWTAHTPLPWCSIPPLTPTTSEVSAVQRSSPASSPEVLRGLRRPHSVR